VPVALRGHEIVELYCQCAVRTGST